jgi:hypothetical protein
VYWETHHVSGKTTIGNEEVLIEVAEDDLKLVGAAYKRQTEPTAIEDKLGEAYVRVKGLIRTIAADFSNTLKDVLASGQKIEMEFSLGLSASSGLWVISAKGEAAIKITIAWEPKL